MNDDLVRWCRAAAHASAALLLLACTPPAPSSPGPAPPASPSALPPCTASDLSVTALAQGATGALAGSVRFEVIAASTCVLPGQPQIGLADSLGEAMPVDEIAVPRADVEVNPGASATVRFVWRNWCGPPPTGSVTMLVVLPGELQPLPVPLVDARGAPMVDTPRCDTPPGPSTLEVGPVVA